MYMGTVGHRYESTNPATLITITGECNTIFVPGLPQLTSIEQWGYTGSSVYLFSGVAMGGPGCTGLTTIAKPDRNTFLNVTDLYGTFAGCTALTSVTEGMFENSKATSFTGTFAGCTNLTGIPDSMFKNCSNVTEFNGTFYGCTSLTTIGAHAFDGCSKVTTFENLFAGSQAVSKNMESDYEIEKCIDLGLQKQYEVMPVSAPAEGYNSNITNIGEYAFANCSSVISFYDAFVNCHNLTSIGSYAFANCSSVKSFDRIFGGCENLVNIGDYLFENCTSAESFSEAFNYCIKLQTIPEHIFDNTPNVTSFAFAFQNCTSLTGNAIPLWERVTTDTTDYIGTPDGNMCYDNCEGLTNFESIPPYWANGIDS